MFETQHTPGPVVADVYVQSVRKRRVLVVDDSKLQRKILSASLRGWGYEVMEAEDGQSALQVCEQTPPELVISDWMMPGMDGLEFCREFRRRSTDQYIYFMLLTSKTEKGEIARGLEAGADDFLTKPVEGMELRARMQAGERILDMQAELTRKNATLITALNEVQRLHDDIARDLKEARQLQLSLVPERFRDYGSASVALMLKSSSYVGGDLVGCYPAGPHHVGLYAIDVSGHGISAALMTARLAGYLSPTAPEQNIALRRDGDEFAPVEPAQAIETLNNLVLDEMDTEHYFTIVLADIDLRTGCVRVGQAGHPHPVIQRKCGALDQESPGGFPVGLMYNASFSSFEIALDPGDRVLFLSDGVTECPDPSGDMLGEEGLSRVVEQLEDVRGAEFFDGLLWHLTEYAEQPSFPDDVSGVLLEYRGG